MQCEHILASIADAGAGPSYSVRGLARGLSAQGVSIQLHTIGGWRSGIGPPAACETPHLSYPQDFPEIPVLKSLAASRGLKRALRHLARSSDIFHIHGLWLMPNVYPSWVTRSADTRLVISPRGMLGAEALAFSPLKKAVFWRAFQHRTLRAAACIHATSESEYEDVRRAGLDNPVAVIPNGVDLPPPTRLRGDGPRIALSLGRIHPKKGLERLLRAWARVEATHGDWSLRIVGPAELGHDEELRRLARALGVQRASIEGPLFGSEKLAAFSAADLFLLPTRNENFAMTVAEALAAGVPVISTKGAPWAGLETEGCGWWVEHGEEALAAAMEEAMFLPREALLERGQRGRAWMERDFSWDRIAGDMLAVYQWLVAGADQPATVRLD